MPRTWPAARAAVARHLDWARFDDVGCRTLLLGLLLSLRDEIVEVRSPETGTPLPDRYRPAPL